MRQKFGASNGLSGGGKMAGIGSNPNYNADQQSQSSSLDLGEASQRAYSLFSTSIAMLGETVSKVSKALHKLALTRLMIVFIDCRDLQ